MKDTENFSQMFKSGFFNWLELFFGGFFLFVFVVVGVFLFVCFFLFFNFNTCEKD